MLEIYYFFSSPLAHRDGSLKKHSNSNTYFRCKYIVGIEGDLQIDSEVDFLEFWSVLKISHTFFGSQ